MIYKSFFYEVPTYFFSCVHVFGVISKSVLPNSRLWRFTAFSTKNFMCVSPILRFLIHVDLIFVCDVRLGSSFILLHMDIQLSQDHFLKIIFFFRWIGLAPLSKINSIPLVHVSTLLAVPHCFDYVSFIVSQSVSPSTLFSFSRLFFLGGHFGSLIILYEFEGRL